MPKPNQHLGRGIEASVSDVASAKIRGWSSIQRLPLLIALAVLLLGLAVTFFAARVEYEHMVFEDRQHFEQLVDRMEAEVQRRVVVYRYGMMGTRSVFAANDTVDCDAFRAIIESREMSQEFPGSLGMGYIERIDDDTAAVGRFIEQLLADGLGLAVTEPSGAAPLADSQIDGRFVVKYVEPMSVNHRALGLDIGAHPARRAAAERAAIQGDAALTEVIQLVQDDQAVPGFMYLLPHYKAGMPTQTAEQRIAALQGWVYMPLLAPVIFDEIERTTGDELSVFAQCNSDEGHQTDLYATAGAEVSDCHGLDTTRHLEVGGRRWTLSFCSSPQFVYLSRSGYVWVWVLGSALSVILAALVYIQGGATRRAVALAQRMTKDLRRYATEAEKATQAKSDFLANMSHEIRTPMTAILGFAELMQQKIDDSESELLEYAGTIQRNGDHLLSLINDILDMSKIEAGKLEVEQIPVRTQAVLSEVAALMRVKADEKMLPIQAETITDVPVTIQTDPVRLRQVLANLVGNAIKFTEQGSVKIEAAFDEQEQTLRFAVIDTGIGMTPDQLDKLFKAFEQADTTTTRKFGGTGLGLHISQRLAEILGGEITCTSTFGQGTTFTLTLKLAGRVSEAKAAAGAVYPQPDFGQAQRRVASTQNAVDEMFGNRPLLDGLRVLFAEDGKDNQRLINHHLTKAGATVTIVENGKLAVEALTQGEGIDGPLLEDPPFDLLLTDMQMPEMDGYTAVRLLRDRGLTMPVFALTAHAMSDDMDKCLNAGCDAYATKPINKQQLLDLCKEVVVELERKQARRGKLGAA